MRSDAEVAVKRADRDVRRIGVADQDRDAEVPVENRIAWGRTGLGLGTHDPLDRDAQVVSRLVREATDVDVELCGVGDDVVLRARLEPADGQHGLVVA